jgi:23S rRNA U2552 (ribose-2'-O)-methylase RlmE/FtsJ
MDIIIFKKNEISPDLFNNQKLFIYNEIVKNEEYGNYKDLDLTKCKIDILDKNSEKNRRAAAKYLHEYELVKILCKKNVISRAYFKLYEMIYNEPLILYENLSCFFICEAPGGFIECVTDIRRKKNLRTDYISISKFNTSIKYDPYLEENNLFYGDITSDIETHIGKALTKFNNGIDLITADGCFDIKNYNSQEIVTSKLLLCEIYIALKTQKTGGTFVIKFFDMFTHNSIMYYLILCSFYQYVRIIKPKTSRNCNSERYLVCSNMHRLNASHDNLINNLKYIILNYKINNLENKNLIIFPDFIINNDIKNKIKSFNNLIVHEQIKTINESIKMINGKNFYFQNLLLKIFLENKIDHLPNIILYKNILSSRICKCISFLRNYNINIHQLF